jgi:DNA-binding SARP family transcriptional activator
VEEDGVPLVRILGPLDVAVGGGRVSVGGERQRLLLGVLALRARQVVTVDELVEALFRRGGTGALHTAISRLRGSLGADWIETHPSGYVLRADAERLDSVRALEAASRAQGVPDLRERAEALRAAEALWRGPVLAGMDVPPSFRADADRLEELRRSIVGDRIEAELALGRHTDLVSELEPLTRVNPFDERLHRAHALALYRSGRQVDALAALSAYRTTLREELALEPSADLRELERAILNHDSALLLPERAAPAPVARAATRRVRRVAGAVVAAALLATGVVVTAVVRSASDGVPLTELDPGTLAVVPIDSDRAKRTFAVGRLPRGLALGYGAAWVADVTDETVSRVTVDGDVVTIGLGTTPTAIAVGPVGVWVIAESEGTLAHLEPSTGRILNRVRLRPGLTDIAEGFGSVWVTNGEAGTLTRVDARHTDRITTVSGLSRPTGIAVDGRSVWVAERTARRLVRIDPRTMRVIDRVPVNLPPGELAAAGGAIWGTHEGAGAVFRFDRRSGVVRVISVGSFPRQIAAGADIVSVVNELEHTISEIDARTGDVVKTLRLSDRYGKPRAITPGAIAIRDDELWLTVRRY